MNIWNSGTDLGHNTITALLQDDVGYIWIGTPGGLLRFDGVQFARFDKSNTPAIKSDYISAIYQNSDKTIWIGTRGGGLVSLRDGNWQNYSLDNGLSDNFVHAITGDWQGHIWIGTDYGLNVFDGDKIKTYGHSQGLFDPIITSLSVGIKGDILIGTFRSGLFRMYKGSIDHIGFDEGLLNFSVTKLLTDSNGRLWIGTLGGLFFLDINENIVEQVKDFGPIPVTDILEIAPDEFWFASMTRGIDCLTDSCRAIKNIPDEYMRCLLRDKDGTIWAGSDAAGLLNFNISQIENITLPEDQIITCATQDDIGNTWIGTRNSGVYKFKDGRIIEKLNRQSGMNSERISTLYFDKKTGLWIGTHDAGVTIQYQNRISHLLTAMQITCFIAANSGSVLIGTSSGLFVRYKDKTKQILNNISVISLNKTKNNVVLITTTDGLYLYSDDKVRHTQLIEPDLSSDLLSICADRNERLFLGTNGSGIIIMDGETSKSITTLQGLPDNHIVSILIDKMDNVWCASYNGVFMIHKEILNDFLNDSLKYIIPLWFTNFDGMISNQCMHTSGFLNDDKLYIPTAKGVSVFNNIYSHSLKSKLLPIQMERIQSGQMALNSIENMIKLPAGNEELRINLTAFDYSAQSKIHFRYKLENYDSDYHYISPGNDRIISYRDLIPGIYTLKIQATSQDAIWGKKFEEYTIAIPYPIFKNPYVQLFLLAFIILISLGFGYRRREKRRRKIKDKYKTVRITPEKTEVVIKEMDGLVHTDKFYLNPDITLKDLAGKLRIHPNHLSRIINEVYKLTYNDFINKYRIEDAKQLLSDPKNSNKTILELMYQCGFYSKSVFNTAFKKFTGQTPSQFRKSQKD
jgi:ligand-binding sensor domain-containing protein/AraC-like DNA-binding protein